MTDAPPVLLPPTPPATWQPDPDSDFCPLPILHHEPFNTRESWHVWNVTRDVLLAGASFCTQH